jgi:hypothetical protein
VVKVADGLEGLAHSRLIADVEADLLERRQTRTFICWRDAPTGDRDGHTRRMSGADDSKAHPGLSADHDHPLPGEAEGRHRWMLTFDQGFTHRYHPLSGLRLSGIGHSSPISRGQKSS